MGASSGGNIDVGETTKQNIVGAQKEEDKFINRRGTSRRRGRQLGSMNRTTTKKTKKTKTTPWSAPRMNEREDKKHGEGCGAVLRRISSRCKVTSAGWSGLPSLKQEIGYGS